MSRITQKGQGASLNLFQQTADASYATMAGQRFDLADGREVLLVSAGASNLVSGKLMQSSAIVANHQNLVTSTAAAGAFQVTVTLGGTAVTANQYAGGFVVFNAGTGLGQTLKIASHPAQATTTGTVVLTLEDAIVTATATSDTKSCLIANPYINVVVNPTTPTATPVGVTFYPITATQYGYVISKGPTSLLADGAIAVGSAISPSNAVAGAVEAGVIAQAFIGRALQAGVDTEYRTVYVDL